jgi:hypothetical protein
MITTIQLGTSGSLLTLATLQDTVEELLLEGQSASQEWVLLRAPSAELLNRGNRVRQLSFTVKRRPLASSVLAARAVAQHELDFAAITGPSFTLTIGTTGAGFVLRFASAVIQHRGRAPGTTSIHNYTVRGGSYTLTDL